MKLCTCLLLVSALTTLTACKSTPESTTSIPAEPTQWQLAQAGDHSLFLVTVHQSQRGFEGENEVQLKKHNDRCIAEQGQLHNADLLAAELARIEAELAPEVESETLRQLIQQAQRAVEES